MEQLAFILVLKISPIGALNDNGKYMYDYFRWKEPLLVYSGELKGDNQVVFKSEKGKHGGLKFHTEVCKCHGT